MASTPVNLTNSAEYAATPSFCGLRWYAAYTRANQEKRVAQQLELRSIPIFLPLYKSTRRWKDRRIQLQLPLFPGYVFVRFALRDRLHVLQIPGVARLVGFNGMAAALPDEQIEAVRRTLTVGLCVGQYPYLTVGQRVRIKSGPLQGQEGILVRRKGIVRVVISIIQISCSMVVDVSARDIEPTLSTRLASRREDPCCV